jgi:hypothetical protein
MAKSPKANKEPKTLTFLTMFMQISKINVPVKSECPTKNITIEKSWLAPYSSIIIVSLDLFKRINKVGVLIIKA